MKIISMKSLQLLALVAMLGFGTVSSAAKLSLGDDAPALTIEKFLKGSEVKTFEKDKVYVVEFWATWCGPCRKSIPHLVELRKKYGEDKVVIIGVAASEYGNEAKKLATLEKFLGEALGKSINYDIGFDSNSSMSKDWMQAAGARGIPTAFIVDKDGKLAYIGHPLNIDSPLEKIVDGSWNTATYVKEQAEVVKAEDAQVKAADAYVAAIKGNDYKEALRAVEELITLKAEPAYTFRSSKLQLLLTDLERPADGHAYAESLVKDHADDAAQLYTALAVYYNGKKPVKNRSPKTTLKIATRLLELTPKIYAQNKEVAAVINPAIALAFAESGDFDKAIVLQKEAIEAAPEEYKAQLEKQLKLLEKLKAMVEETK